MQQQPNNHGQRKGWGGLRGGGVITQLPVLIKRTTKDTRSRNYEAILCSEVPLSRYDIHLLAWNLEVHRHLILLFFKYYIVHPALLRWVLQKGLTQVPGPGSGTIGPTSIGIFTWRRCQSQLPKRFITVNDGTSPEQSNIKCSVQCDVHYCVQKSSPMEHILSQTIPATFTPYSI